MTILGPGLLGASLGMAARANGLAGETTVWARRPEARAACLQQDWCDRTEATLEAAVGESDLVVLCTPVRHVETTLDLLAPHAPPGCLVTDVGSVKGAICQAAEQAFSSSTSPATFIGSHPMAGSEKGGMEHAGPDLFEGRPCFVTPGPDAPAEQVEAVHTFWEKLGMTVTQVEPAEHDAIVAHVSHLPHALASCLAHALAGQPETWGTHAGQGLRDTTRIASGDPTLWEEIFSQNRAAVLEALDSFQRAVSEFKGHVETSSAKELRAFLTTGKTFRDSLPPSSQA